MIEISVALLGIAVIIAFTLLALQKYQHEAHKEMSHIMWERQQLENDFQAKIRSAESKLSELKAHIGEFEEYKSKVDALVMRAGFKL